MTWYFVIGGLISSYVLTAGLRQYALRRDLLDIPNERSSHQWPTPRAGGLAIVLVFLSGLAFAITIGEISWSPAAWMGAAGALVAIVGFMDDRGDLSARWRFLVHLTAASLVVYAVGLLPPLTVAGLQIDLGWIGCPIAVLGAAWLLNLYNFMDGIDGIAGVEALCGTAVMAFLLYCTPGGEQLALLHLLMAAAVLGFLLWNFPPAKIFMGDVGSGFIGLMLAGFLLWSLKVDSRLLWSWLIMLGVFVVDSTFTLLRRLARGDKVYEAHCSHAYQVASRRFGSHLPVTVAVLVINLLWLTPLAIWGAWGHVDGMWITLIAYAPLVALDVYFNAGSAQNQLLRNEPENMSPDVAAPSARR